jgi:hypothetical protein
MASFWAQRRPACAAGGLVARIGAPCSGPFRPILKGVRCRSSVVEHSIGNGEVDSSILSGSTIPRSTEFQVPEITCVFEATWPQQAVPDVVSHKVLSFFPVKTPALKLVRLRLDRAAAIEAEEICRGKSYPAVRPASARRTAAGSFAMMASRMRAVRSGRRRPCSQAWTAVTCRPNARAKPLCQSPRRCRSFATSTRSGTVTV